jgi:phospholipase/carboxylesterase
MNFERISDFDVITKKGNSSKAVIVLHGYGASFQDLAPLYQYLDPAGELNWYFVDGPLSVDIGMGMMGKAWFPIDMMGLQTALVTGTFEKVFADHSPEGLEEITQRIQSLLTHLKEQHDSIFLGGFSQGSMVSSSVALKERGLIDKLFLLSSTIYDEQRFSSEVENLKTLPTFQSHGNADPVLPVTMANKLNEILKENVDEYEYHPFPGGHEIPLPVIENLKSFLHR